MTPEVMSPFGILMGGFCVAAVMLILWLLATEGVAAIRKRRAARDPYEAHLKRLVDEVDQRHNAREADRAARQRTRERWGL